MANLTVINAGGERLEVVVTTASGDERLRKFVKWGQADVAGLMRVTGLRMTQILALIERVRKQPLIKALPPPSQTIAFEWAGDDAPGQTCKLTADGREMDCEDPVECLAEVVALGGSEISWTGTEVLCGLAVRAGSGEAISPGRLEDILSLVASLAPVVGGRTVDGGLCLLYARTDGATAREWAATAALVIHSRTQGLTTDFVSRVTLASGAEPRVRAEPLDMRSLRAELVREVDGPLPYRVAVMVRCGTHYQGQADAVLRTDLPALSDPDVRRCCYLGAVAVYHGRDAYAAKHCGSVGSDLIRLRDGWASPEDLTLYTDRIGRMIERLPVCREPDSGEVDYAVRDRLLQAGDLGAKYGYFPLHPQWGFPVGTTHRRHPDGRVLFPAVSPLFRGDKARFAPQYRRPSERMPLSEAWSLVEDVLPGVNRPYIELLIVQKGFVQLESEVNPFIGVEGPTSSQKGAGPLLSGAFTGDKVNELIYSRNVERIYQGIQHSVGECDYVTLHELFKNAAFDRRSAQEAAELILSLTPDGHAHKLYKGQTPFRRVPALVITDTTMDPTVMEDWQIGRRLIHVRLGRSVDWTPSVTRAGLANIKHWRLWKPEAALAADAIVSDITDRFFGDRLVTWREAAEELGFRRLCDESGSAGLHDRLVEFFALVCDAEPLNKSEARRVTGPGWKCIKRGEPSELMEVWTGLADGTAFDKWLKSRKVQAADWNKELADLRADFGIPDGEIRVDLRPHNNSVFVRFYIQGGSDEVKWSSGLRPQREGT